MRILMITAARTGPEGDRALVSSVGRARALRDLGHEVVVLQLSTSPVHRSLRAESTSSRTEGIDLLSVELPPLPGPLRRLLPGLLRRTLPRALRVRGVIRPDLLHADAELTAASAAQTLSVLSGVPQLILAQDEHGSAPSDRRDSAVLGHALQEAVTVAATPHAARQLQRTWVLPALDVLPDGGWQEQARALAALSTRALETAVGPRMVFHAPYALEPAPSSASRQRPNKMLEAFSRTGYRVHLMTGDPGQRRRDFAELRLRRRAGQPLAFVYSENSTQPNLLSTSAFRGLAPLLEARLLEWCARNAIPFGQFYRDVYWRFSEKQSSVAPMRRLLMQAAYRFDLAALRRFGAHFFVPSMQMAPIVPVPVSRCTELPPGAQISSTEPGAGLRLLYVGGVGPGHEIDECLAALRDVEQSHLTMVVPHAAWEAHRERYLPLLTERVRVLHANAGELAELYDGVSACLLLVEPNEYRDFAVPMKLYEYLGHGKPTLASQRTLAGTIVEDLGIGFTAPNERTQIAALLERLLEDPAELDLCADRVRRVRHEQSWAARARTVDAELTGGHET